MNRAMLGVSLGLFLAGCGSFGGASLNPGSSTEADARSSMGTPGLEIVNPDGTRQLAFPRGPLGAETYMVFLSRDGIVARIEQVLTDDSFQRIRAGETTREDVRRMIGPPWRTVRFDNLRQDAWDYRFRDTWGYLADFSVMIDDRGVVASKVIARIESGRDGSAMGR